MNQNNSMVRCPPKAGTATTRSIRRTADLRSSTLDSSVPATIAENRAAVGAAARRGIFSSPQPTLEMYGFERIDATLIPLAVELDLNRLGLGLDLGWRLDRRLDRRRGASLLLSDQLQICVTLSVPGDETVDANPARRAPHGEDDDGEQCVERTHARRSRHHVGEEEQEAGETREWCQESNRQGGTDGEFTERDQDADPSGIGNDEAVQEAPHQLYAEAA